MADGCVRRQGNRCKFSHDLNVGKKAAKIDLYTDNRDADKEEDKMDTWDQSKLEEVVKEKHGEKVVTQTDIVCKHFLDAIERSLYGWFWVCPNGGKACKYVICCYVDACTLYACSSDSDAGYD